MPKDERARWQAVVDVALNRTPDNPLAKSLARIRNKVSAHYDPGEIFSGYKGYFLADHESAHRPYVSQGRSMAETRFYFSDAATQGYFEQRLGETAGEFFNTVNSVINDVNFAVMALVHHFILKRGGSFREIPD